MKNMTLYITRVMKANARNDFTPCRDFTVIFYFTFTSLLLWFRRRRRHRANHVILFVFVAVLCSVQATFTASFVRHFQRVTKSYWSETNAFEVCASAGRGSLGKFVYIYIHHPPT